MCTAGWHSARGQYGRGGTRVWEKESLPLIDFRVSGVTRARLGPQVEGTKLGQLLQLRCACIVPIIEALSASYLKDKVERGDEIMKRDKMKAKRR